MRRTITIPDRLDSQVRELADEGESFSAAISRLVEAGLREDRQPLAWIGSGESGEPDLALCVEQILDELAREADPSD